jgi:hypothetical protein
VPLVRDATGRRLAKRDGDEGLDSLRARGMTAERVAGWVAWCVGAPALEPLDPSALARLLDPATAVGGLRELAAQDGTRVDSSTLAWLTGDDAAADMLRRDARGGPTR